MEFGTWLGQGSWLPRWEGEDDGMGSWTMTGRRVFIRFFFFVFSFFSSASSFFPSPPFFLFPFDRSALSPNLSPLRRVFDCTRTRPFTPGAERYLFFTHHVWFRFFLLSLLFFSFLSLPFFFFFFTFSFVFFSCTKYLFPFYASTLLDFEHSAVSFSVFFHRPFYSSLFLLLFT